MPPDTPSGLSRRTAVFGLGAGLLASACRAKLVAVPVLDSGPAGGWTISDPFPYPVQEIYPCLHRDAIHVAGGFVAEFGRIAGPTDLHSRWRPDGIGWRPASPLPEVRHHPHLTSFRNHLFVIGGFTSPSAEAVWTMRSTGWILDDLKGSWTPAPALPVPIGEAVMLVGGTGMLHLAGGRSPAGQSNANWQDHTDQTHHFVLDDPAGVWRTAAPCLTARNSAAGSVIDGQLHVVGGRSVGGGNTSVHEVYDPAEDRWRSAAPLPQAQGGLAAAETGGRLYAFGGEFFDNGGGVYAETWVYDPATDGWSAIEPMPTPRHGLGAVALGGAIHVIAGARQAGGVETSDVVEIYTP